MTNALKIAAGGVMNTDQFYTWINCPDLSHVERYNPARMLAECAEVDEDTYDYFLGMLPPMNFTHDGFAICEAATGNIRLAFFRAHGRFFAAYISDTNPAHKMAAVRDRVLALAQQVAA